MITDKLVSSCEFNLLKFGGTHAVGFEQNFERPYIGYINKGSAQFLYKGKSYLAGEGDLIYIAKGTKYYSDIVNNSWHIFLKHSHTYAVISKEL